MARKTSLREFQQNVAQRMRDLALRNTVPSKLGFQVGAENWLVTLADVSEVISLPATAPVPLTQDWYKGVANVRGKLYSVSDFAAFQGLPAASTGLERRVILIAERLIEGSGLVVSRMLGLRNPEQFTREPAGDTAGRSWVGARYRDATGTIWFELDLQALSRNSRFLEVASAPLATVAA